MGTSPIVPHGRTSTRESGPTTVFRPFRRLLGTTDNLAAALRELCVTLEVITAVQKSHGPAIERLEALELSRHQFEAMCEGLLRKAEGKWRAANNAEARERANKKSYEHLLDPLDEIGEEPEATAPNANRDDDAAFSEAERLSAMRLDVAANPKALAQRAKFGVR